MCEGITLLVELQIINMSKLVWAFDIKPGLDATTGRQLSKEEINDSVETQWTNGFLTAPKPFPVTLQVRSEEHQAVIDSECKKAQVEVFPEYDD